MELTVLGCTFLAALLLNLVLTPQIVRLSHRFSWYDRPASRKIHKELVPRLGGIGIFTSFIIAIIFVPIVTNLVWPDLVPTFFEWGYLPVLVGFLVIYLLGLIDDFRNLPAWVKFLVQIAAAVIVVSGGFVVTSVSLPYIGKFELGFFGYPLTVLWIVGVTNAINLMDGMDGLAGGISGFAALSMGIIALIQGQMLPAIISFSLFGSILGFLRYNFPPARIFMGDSGSLFLGFALSVLPLMGVSRAGSLGSLLVPITILLVPIIDTFSAILRRIKNKKSIASPDKEHIHHKLLEIGLSEKKILAIIYFICLYLSAIAITSVVLPKEVNVYLILIVWVGSMLGYGILNILETRKKLQKEKDNGKTGTSAG